MKLLPILIMVSVLSWPSQFSLRQNGSIGCAPTAVSYLTRYYARPISAQKLFDDNFQHFVPGAGMSPEFLMDDITPNFISEIFFRKVPAYPFLAVVRMHGGNHSVAVTYYTEQAVMFLDPWDGEPHTLTWSKFRSAWPCRCGLVIRPHM